MRLLFLNHNPEGMGTFFRCRFLARYLVPLGHTIRIVCSSKKKFDLTIRRRTLSEGVEVITLPAIVLHRFLTGRMPRAVIGSFASAFQRYDLVHAFAVSQPETALPALVARLVRSQPMITDWDDDWGRGILADHPAPIRWPYDFLEKRAIRLGNVTTVVSEYLRQRTIECGVPEDRVFMIPNGANVDEITPLDRAACRKRLDLPPDAPLIVSMGHTYYIHKIHFLLDGFRKVLDRMPDAKLCLVGGLNPKEVSAYCGDLMDRIILAGERPSSEVQHYLGAADVLALPMDTSIFEISRFPIRIGDYLASGRAVVSNAVGEVKRILEAEKCGLTCDPDDVDGFAEALCRVLSDSQLAREFGLRSRAAAEERHSWQKIAGKLSDLYAERSGES